MTDLSNIQVTPANTNKAKAAARKHAAMMYHFHRTMLTVAKTSDELLGALINAAGTEQPYQEIRDNIDTIMADLDSAYQRLAAAFDDLPE